MNKLPANFDVDKRNHPFKVSVRGSNNKFECTIEPYSLVYDFFNDKKVIIKGIENTYPCKAGDKIILNLKIEKKGLSISSATIRVSTGDPIDPQYSPCFPLDRYYSSEQKCLTEIEILIATLQEKENSKIPKLEVLQNVYRNISIQAARNGVNSVILI